jgi:hypothetical protein
MSNNLNMLGEFPKKLFLWVGLISCSWIISGWSQQFDLVPKNSVWKFLDNGSDQGTAWIQPNFDDSSWASGPAELGYGDGDEATVLRYEDGDGPTAANFGPVSAKFVTSYFRHKFTVTNLTQFASISLWVLRDDGAIVYLNGKEAARSNMPEGPITSTTFAVKTVGGKSESEFVHHGLSTNILQEGVNLIAVEVHQSRLVSTDMSMNVQLTGILPIARRPLARGATNAPPQTIETPLEGKGTESTPP